MSTDNQFLQIEEDIVKVLKTVYDPEIPVNIYDLGLTSMISMCSRTKVGNHHYDPYFPPNCPHGRLYSRGHLGMKGRSVRGIKEVEIKLTFEPEGTVT